jgi:hypothetical protein
LFTKPEGFYQIRLRFINEKVPPSFFFGYVSRSITHKPCEPAVILYAVDAKATFGGAFATIRPEQQRLVRSWVAEYNKLNGSKLSATRVYDQLPNSFRTTFDAVTHALLNTTLTDEAGKTMGKAIDLVEMIESIHGQVQGLSGDKQFRLYVLLRKDAVDKLYACREFKRGADNSVFHKGYPINFRQDGGAPSIQFSMTRTDVAPISMSTIDPPSFTRHCLTAI